MRRNRLSFVPVVFLFLTISGAQASTISQRPQRFESSGGRYYAAGYGATFVLPSSPDNWLGGTGNWSNGAEWSAGLPGSNSDVTINTGSDNVALDTSSSINSLTLGGSTGNAKLTGDGSAHSVAIAGALTVNQSGNLYLSMDSVTAGANFTNVGTMSLEYGSSLQVNGDASNSGTLNAGLSNASSGNILAVAGTLTNSGNIEIGFRSDTSGGTGSATVGQLNNIGTLGLALSASLTVNGDVSNSGALILGKGGPVLSVSGNFINSGSVQTPYNPDESRPTVSIGGLLTNTATGSFNIIGPISVGSLVNQGQLNLNPSAMLQVAGDAVNSGTISVSSGMNLSTLKVQGTVTNNAGAQLTLVDSFGSISAASLTNHGTVSIAGLDDNLLNISGDVQNTGTINIGGAIATMQAASLTNNGSIQVSMSSTLHISGDVANSGAITTNAGARGNTIFIAGKLTNSAGSAFELNATNDVANIGYITNAGIVSLASTTSLNVTGGSHAAVTALPGFLNTGVVNLFSGSTLSSPLTYSQTSGQTTVDGTLRVSSRGTINFAGGSVYGNQGTIQGSIVSNAAINLGDSPLTIGQMTFAGNYNQGANGSLTFDIAGSAAGQYDQLNVSGHAQLNGLMTVDLLHGYVPQVGNTFDIMNFASSSGSFSMVVGLPINGQEHFVLEYNSTNLTLDVVSGQLTGPSSVAGNSFASDPFIPTGVDGALSLIASNNRTASPAPEPSSILLFGSGMVGLGGLLRRRNRG